MIFEIFSLPIYLMIPAAIASFVISYGIMYVFLVHLPLSFWHLFGQFIKTKKPKFFFWMLVIALPYLAVIGGVFVHVFLPVDYEERMMADHHNITARHGEYTFLKPVDWYPEPNEPYPVYSNHNGSKMLIVRSNTKEELRSNGHSNIEDYAQNIKDNFLTHQQIQATYRNQYPMIGDQQAVLLRVSVTENKFDIDYLTLCFETRNHYNTLTLRFAKEYAKDAYKNFQKIIDSIKLTDLENERP